MKAITNKLLIKLAGKPAFGRGEDYFNTGAVLDIYLRGKKIHARVEGNEIYQVTLTHTNTVFEGYCDCPASENFDFCKHCVAAAMQYNQDLNRVEQQKAGPPMERLSAYLNSFSKEQLIGEFCDLIQNDRTLQDNWTLRADAALGTLDYKSVRKRITVAIPYNRHLYRYQQVSAYFNRLELKLEPLLGLLDNFTPEQALGLVEYALKRIYRALEHIDDSGGFRFYCVDCLHKAHLESCARLNWPPKRLANHLFKIYFSDDDEIYPPIPESYLETLKLEGLDHFSHALEKQWNELPPFNPNLHWDVLWPYLKLNRPLIASAEAKGDINHAIALKARVADKRTDYLDLSDYCLQHDKPVEATEWLRKAERINSPYSQDRLKPQQVKIWLAQGKYKKALDMQWKIFRDRPFFHQYQHLLEIAAKRQNDIDWKKETTQFLYDRIEGSDNEFSRQTDIDTLAEILIHEQRNSDALTLAEQYPIDVELLLKIAISNSSQPHRALPLYIRYADNEVKQTNNKAYRRAVKILKMAKKELGNAYKDKIYEEIRKLRFKHKAKRNFIKYLVETFPGL